MNNIQNEIEEGMASVRTLLAKRLMDGDLTGTADLALALIALVAARDRNRDSEILDEERVAVLKFPSHLRVVPERREASRATSKCKETVAETPQLHEGVVVAPGACFETCASHLRLYRED
ncbi:MAG: hypothetical protein ACOX0A_05360 [Thermoguttaceae bacterium]